MRVMRKDESLFADMETNRVGRSLFVTINGLRWGFWLTDEEMQLPTDVLVTLAETIAALER